MGIGYNAALTAFGGTAPLVATAMTSKTGLSGYAWILFLYCILSLSVEALATYFRKTGSLDTATSTEKNFNHTKIDALTDEHEQNGLDLSKLELVNSDAQTD